jgi:hypothetical protein
MEEGQELSMRGTSLGGHGAYGTLGSGVGATVGPEVQTDGVGPPDCALGDCALDLRWVSD